MTATHTDSDTSMVESDYDAFRSTAKQISRVLTTAVVEPVAKQHFEIDRGYPVTQELPDRSTEYTFTSHGFEATVLPDQRTVVNTCYNGNRITPAGITRNITGFTDVISDAKKLWVETFGKYKPHVTQPDHPGPFPVPEESMQPAVTALQSAYDSIHDTTDLDTIIAITRDGNYPLLTEVFGTTEPDIFTPGGTDLSAVTNADEIHVPYNDGRLAVLRPISQSRVRGPVRGVIIGQDDTPTGVFAHVTDVTNLDPDGTTTNPAIQDAMGFDRELDPWNLPDHLAPTPGTRIRLQGDLRVERATDITEFPDEVARRERLTEYETRLDRVFSTVTIPPDFIRRATTGIPLSSVLTYTVDADDASVVVEETTDDVQVAVLAYAAGLLHVDAGVARDYDSHSDIPYVMNPESRPGTVTTGSPLTAARRARQEFTASLEAVLERDRGEIETAADVAAETASDAIDAPRQVNVPVDNHMVFIESGFAPDVETEPLPVAVPEQTTLHLVHGEHNTVTTQIPPGVYRFSLLPRGLQPANTRPDW